MAKRIKRGHTGSLPCVWHHWHGARCLARQMLTGIAFSKDFEVLLWELRHSKKLVAIYCSFG